MKVGKEKRKIFKENIVIIIVALIILAFAIFRGYTDFVSLYKLKCETAALSCQLTDERTIVDIDKKIKEIYMIAETLNNSGNRVTFDTALEGMNMDFRDKEFVGIFKDGELSNVYPYDPAMIGKNPLSNFQTLQKIQNDDGSVVEFLYNNAIKELNIMWRVSLYDTVNNEKIYKGEMATLINMNARCQKQLDDYLLAIKSDIPIRKRILVGEELYETASNRLVAMTSPQTFTINTYIKAAVNDKKGILVKFIVDFPKRRLIPNMSIIIISFIYDIFTILIVAILIKLIFKINRIVKNMNMQHEAKVDFFTSVAYEIRRIVDSIISFRKDIDSDDLPDRAKRYIEASRVDLDELKKKSENMLDLSSVKWKNANVTNEDYYVHNLIDELTGMYNQDLEAIDGSWVIDIAKDMPIMLRGSKGTIKKILSHIIECCLKLMIDGKIKIGVYAKRIRHKENQVLLKFVITDSSMGMKEDAIEEILTSSNFSSCKDGKIAQDAKFELFVAKGLIESLGGTFDMKSSYGKSTTYIVTLTQTVIDDREMTDDIMMSLNEKFRNNLGRLKRVNASILVVDDNESNLNMISNLIRFYGAHVDSVKSGHEAIQKISENRYDLMFIDHLMPDKDGVETLKEIKKKNKKYKNVPAVLITANTQGNEVVYKNVGFLECLNKPITQSNIELSLKTLLPIESIVCQELDR